MIDVRPVTSAVLAMLRERVPVPVGDGQAPLNVAPPYVILYSLGIAGLSGTFGRPEEDLSIVYQATVVGETRAQVELGTDAVRQAFLGRHPSGRFTHSITVAGAVVGDRSWDSSSGFDAGLDLGIPQQADRYRLWLTPA